MMLPARHRRQPQTQPQTQQQVARNKVGVLLVPSVADYYNSEQVPSATHTPAISQLELHAAAGGGDNSKYSFV
ncbi:CG42809 [Drosophila busckii]|uniref:CG42809 n=1 Tax=Drosophila busckii TaxID=30019 RepID=A0A0M4EAQ5_DROBS|nr:CG42809 [Drosophila busckii]